MNELNLVQLKSHKAIKKIVAYERNAPSCRNCAYSIRRLIHGNLMCSKFEFAIEMTGLCDRWKDKNTKQELEI